MVMRGCSVMVSLLVALLASAAPAGADGPVVDGTTVTATEAEGTATAEIKVVNTTRDPVTLPSAVTLNDTCDATVEEPVLPALQPSTIKLTFDASCFGEAVSLKADFDGTGPLPPITIKKPADDTSDWAPFGYALALSIVCAVALGFYGYAQIDVANTRRQQRDNENGDNSEEATKRRETYDAVTDIVDKRVQELHPPYNGDLEWNAFPAPGDFGFKTEVKGLEAGWSFKDSWASNLTVATAAFVALFNSADALTALLGEKPEAALAVMTVAGLVSAVLIAVANTVAKLVGTDTSTVTAGGLVLSTAVVVLGAALQVFTVGLTAIRLVTSTGVDLAVGLGMVAVAAVLIVYAGRATRSTLIAGAPDAALPVIPTDALESWDDDTGQPTDPAQDASWRSAVVKERILSAYESWLTLDTTAGAAVQTAWPAMVQAVALEELTTRKSLI